MSIYNLTQSAIDSTMLTKPSHLQDMANPVGHEVALPGAVPATPSRTDTLENLTKYIPTESITLFVAGMGISAATPETTQVFLRPEFLYWLCAVLTPIIFLLFLIRGRATQGLALRPEKWPIWNMVAATIAFLVWALAVPNSPYLDFPGGAALASFMATFVSLFLSLLDPLFNRVVR